MSTIQTITSLFSQTGPQGVGPVVKKASTKAFTPQTYRPPSETAASLSLSTKNKANQSVLSGAVRNAGEANSVISTAQGGIDRISSALERMKEIAEAAEETDLSDFERSFLELELNDLRGSIDEIVQDTTFEGIDLLDGTYSKLIQIGEFPPITIEISFDDASADALFDSQSTSVLSSADATTAVSRIDEALGRLGAIDGQAQSLTSSVDTAVKSLQDTSELREAVNINLENVSDQELQQLALNALEQDAARSTLAQAKNIDPPLLEQTLNNLQPLTLEKRSDDANDAVSDGLQQAQAAIQAREQANAQETVRSSASELSTNSDGDE